MQWNIRKEKTVLSENFEKNKKSRKPLKKVFGVVCGAPEGIRIPDLPLRRRTLYPAELRAHISFYRLWWRFWEHFRFFLGCGCVIFSSPIALLWVNGERSFVTLGDGRSIHQSFINIFKFTLYILTQKQNNFKSFQQKFAKTLTSLL